MRVLYLVILTVQYRAGVVTTPSSLCQLAQEVPLLGCGLLHLIQELGVPQVVEPKLRLRRGAKGQDQP